MDVWITKLGLPGYLVEDTIVAAMKKLIALALLASVPAYAGTSAKSSKAVVPAPADPCLFTWFAGGSVGYLTELEEEMYTLHVGTDTCWNIGGWDIALFAEVGFANKEESFRNFNTATPQPDLDDNDSYSLDDLESILNAVSINGRSSYELDIMPITGNVKFERALTGNLNAYFGAGLGLANVDLSVTSPVGSGSDDDWVFVAQVFAGLVYNVSPNFEVFGGARWIYFDDADLSSGGFTATLELNDDVLLELGGRFNF
jgi:opacity protein-like surface antigen